MRKQCCTKKIGTYQKNSWYTGHFSSQYGVRSLRAPLRDDAHENERIARENEKNEARGDEGARPGVRRSEASPNWSILSTSCLFATPHASWRRIVRVSHTCPTSIEVRSTSSSTGVGGRRVLKARDARSSRRSRIRFNQVQSNRT